METSKTKAVPAESIEPTPALFVHAPRAPAYGHGSNSWQCLFGGEHYVVKRYSDNGWMQAGVWRNSETAVAELRTLIYMNGVGAQRMEMALSADEMQTLACALLDAAHHLRTVPATTYVASATADAEAVPA